MRKLTVAAMIRPDGAMQARGGLEEDTTRLQAGFRCAIGSIQKGGREQQRLNRWLTVRG